MILLSSPIHFLNHHRRPKTSFIFVLLIRSTTLVWERKSWQSSSSLFLPTTSTTSSSLFPVANAISIQATKTTIKTSTPTSSSSSTTTTSITRVGSIPSVVSSLLIDEFQTKRQGAVVHPNNNNNNNNKINNKLDCYSPTDYYSNIMLIRVRSNVGTWKIVMESNNHNQNKDSDKKEKTSSSSSSSSLSSSMTILTVQDLLNSKEFESWSLIQPFSFDPSGKQPLDKHKSLTEQGIRHGSMIYCRVQSSSSSKEEEEKSVFTKAKDNNNNNSNNNNNNNNNSDNNNDNHLLQASLESHGRAHIQQPQQIFDALASNEKTKKKHTENRMNNGKDIRVIDLLLDSSDDEEENKVPHNNSNNNRKRPAQVLRGSMKQNDDIIVLDDSNSDNGGNSSDEEDSDDAGSINLLDSDSSDDDEQAIATAEKDTKRKTKKTTTTKKKSERKAKAKTTTKRTTSKDSPSRKRAKTTSTTTTATPGNVSSAASRSSTTSQLKKSSTDSSGPQKFQIVSYNVWFGPPDPEANQVYPEQRMKAIVKAIEQACIFRKNDNRLLFVGFQEITSSLRMHLQPALAQIGYKLCTQPNLGDFYGVGLAVPNDLDIVESKFIPFPESTQGRGLLYVQTQHLLFGTCHLESFVDAQRYTGVRQREQQIVHAAEFCQEKLVRDDRLEISILAGDFNWDDERKRGTGPNKELLSLLSSEWNDAGNPFDYTYDGKENPMLSGNLRRRFDRCIYLARDNKYHHSSLEKIGKEAIPKLSWNKKNPYNGTSRQVPGTCIYVWIVVALKPQYYQLDLP